MIMNSGVVDVLKEIVFEKDRIERKARELGGGKE